VVDMGSKVSGFSKGDRVAADVGGELATVSFAGRSLMCRDL